MSFAYVVLVSCSVNVRSIPHVFFHDEDDSDDVLDADDIFDDDFETGETMVVLPRNWTNLTLQDLNDGNSSSSSSSVQHTLVCLTRP